MDKPKERRERYVKIIFEQPDEKNTKKIITYSFKDDYNEDFSYEENVDRLAGIAFDEGGMWIDKETIIPYHRICAFICCKKSNRPKEARRKKKVRKPQQRRSSPPPKKKEYKSGPPKPHSKD